MPSQSSRFDIARYLISCSHPNSTIHISAAALSSTETGISSFQQSGFRHIRNMYPLVGCDRGFRNDSSRYRTANYEQPFHTDEDRCLPYPSALLNDEGGQVLTPMSCTYDIPWRTATSGPNIWFNMPMANDDRRRRSSSISPRTIRAPTYQALYSRSFPALDCQELTSPCSNNFLGHPTQAQAAAEPNPRIFQQPSLSTVSTSFETCSTTTYTETPTETAPGPNQRAIFTLLSDICTEALRRKWHSESFRQSIRSLRSRHAHRTSRYRHRSQDRYHPYATRHSSQQPQRTGHTPAPTPTPLQQQPVHFMELMRCIASAMWENASLPPQPELESSAAAHDPVPGPPRPLTSNSGEAETAVIEAMRTLYSLGNSVVAATRAGHQESFNADEMRDIVGVAAGFCRVLGYAEGADQCEEVGRRDCGGGEVGRWEGEGAL